MPNTTYLPKDEIGGHTPYPRPQDIPDKYPYLKQESCRPAQCRYTSWPKKNTPYRHTVPGQINAASWLTSNAAYLPEQ